MCDIYTTNLPKYTSPGPCHFPLSGLCGQARLRARCEGISNGTEVGAKDVFLDAGESSSIRQGRFRMMNAISHFIHFFTIIIIIII